MDTKELENAKIRKLNMRLYPDYMMFGYNLLFYFGISVIYLSEVKGLSDSAILLLNTMFAMFSIIIQLPATLIISKIGNKNSAIIGNILNMCWGIVTIFLTSFEQAVFAQFLRAFALSLKTISESNLLSHSIPEGDVKNRIHSNIVKKGYARHYILIAVTTVLSGFLYEINPYIPIVMSIICSGIALLLSCNFTDIKYEKKRKNNEIKTLNKYYKDLVKGLRFTLTSKRLLSLFLFTGTIYGVISLSTTYELAILQYLGMPAKLIGLFYAMLSLATGVVSRDALKFNKRHKNHSLTNILSQYSISFILIGCLTLLNINNGVKAGIIIIISLITASLHGLFSILKKRYFNSFASDKVSPSINSVRHVVDNTAIIITTYLGSVTLMFYNIGISIIIVGILLIIITLAISEYSKNKLGLKPSEYTKQDIYIKQ